MLEIKFHTFKEGLEEFLESIGIYMVEDDFDSVKTFTIYCEESLLQDITPFIENYSINSIENSGWEYKWKEFLRAGQLTPNIKYIFDANERDSQSCILINPSLAFGTGNHPTTQLAAELLEECCAGKTVLDIGCGTGILALTAKVSGAKKVLAFDNDSLAIKNTKENMMLNNATDILFWAGTPDSIKNVKLDIVIANIISSVLLKIRGDILRLDPNIIILSGILTDELKSFLENLNLVNYSIEKISNKNGWTAVRLTKCLKN
ncbi:MAG: 50S ribosomal protein L11 methyltransferase [Calditerrivibrio sp.]|nr:50S ribosomal protein L11 methyltransferase [Calditerrivibrio sp.]